MRKMTKTAVTLAAMSAMTIASASLAFAATSQRDQLSAVENPAAAANPNSGKWAGNNADGWTFTPADEKKLANTWAEIDGVWYYFHKDGIMARDELVYMEGETYYFTPTGAMAVGWYAFDNDSDVLYDYDLDVQDNIDDINNPVFRNREDAYDTIWMYFYSDGKAADDEWVNPGSGLWYYFDDIVMACGDYDHAVGNAYYGFAEDGHMYVGWEQNVVNAHIKAPNKEENSWYYYDSNGKKFNVVAENNGFGWKKIDGKWYCFREQEENNTEQDFSVGTLIIKAYFNNGVTADDKAEYYYVDKNGVMATGVVSVEKSALYVKDADDWTNQTKVESMHDEYGTKGDTWDVLFGSDGKAKEGWDGNRYYANMGATNTKSFNKDSYAVTGYTKKGMVLKGALVKEAFINKSDHIYYVDKYGDKVVNHALQVGTANGYLGTSDNITGVDNFQADDTGRYKAFVLFNSKGEAYEDVALGRTVKVGSKKYVAVDTYDDAGRDITLFMYENLN